jgi:hypothetical protein
VIRTSASKTAGLPKVFSRGTVLQLSGAPAPAKTVDLAAVVSLTLKAIEWQQSSKER